jgi:hypothetical protein
MVAIPVSRRPAADPHELFYAPLTIAHHEAGRPHGVAAAR